jgi:hypothetical protein
MKKNIPLIVLLISALLTSCSYPHYYYSPNVQHVPLFMEKDQFSGLAAVSIGLVNPSIELHAGYALPGHVALMVNYMGGGTDNSTDTYSDFSKYRYFEGGLGFYRAFNEIGVFEIYGGYGGGTQDHTFAYCEYDNWSSWHWVPDGEADMSFSKVFIQPDIGIKKDWFETSFSCRFSKLNYTEINVYNTVHRLEELNLLKENKTPWLIEPAFTFRAGGKSVKGQMQLVFAGNLTNPDLLFETFRINFGVHFLLSKKKIEK